MSRKQKEIRTKMEDIQEEIEYLDNSLSALTSNTNEGNLKIYSRLRQKLREEYNILYANY